MKRIILLFILATGGLYFPFVQAQDISTAPLVWSVTQLRDLATSQDEVYQCTFSTNGNQNIVWSQRGGAILTTLIVQSSSGGWTNVSTNGQIVYNVALNGQTGALTIERNTTNIFITLNLSQSTGGRLNHRYTVSQVN